MKIEHDFSKDYVRTAKLGAFKEAVRILNDRRYKTERRIEACIAIAAFPIDELDRIIEEVSE